jgi:hypothetical protein
MSKSICEDSAASTALFSMLHSSIEITRDYPALSFYHMALQVNPAIRTHYIKKIKEIMTVIQVPPEVRDTSIQIFDKFMSYSLLDDASLAHNEPYVYISTVVSTILSLKMHYMKSKRVMSIFPDFSVEELEKFERKVLVTLDFGINPTIAPSNFISHLLETLPEQTRPQKNDISLVSNQLLELFWEDPDSILYAPSTVAIAAILLALYILRIDFIPWISIIPDYCLMREENPCYSIIASFRPDIAVGCGFFDIDRCLANLRSSSEIRRYLSNGDTKIRASGTSSPTSVACSSAMDDDGGHER